MMCCLPRRGVMWLLLLSTDGWMRECGEGRQNRLNGVLMYLCLCGTQILICFLFLGFAVNSLEH